MYECSYDEMNESFRSLPQCKGFNIEDYLNNYREIILLKYNAQQKYTFNSDNFKKSIKDFLNCMEEPRPPYTTVASIVKNLEKKGYVQAKRYGNTYVYSPSIDEGEYKTKFLSGVVQNYFENSYKEMVTFFARKQKISAKELEEIIRLIEKE